MEQLGFPVRTPSPIKEPRPLPHRDVTDSPPVWAVTGEAESRVTGGATLSLRRAVVTSKGRSSLPYISLHQPRPSLHSSGPPFTHFICCFSSAHRSPSCPTTVYSLTPSVCLFKVKVGLISCTLMPLLSTVPFRFLRPFCYNKNTITRILYSTITQIQI